MDEVGRNGRIRPVEIGDEELRVEDLMAWLEGMDPLKTVRIVMKTRDSVVASDIHTITEEDGTVDIFPTKMPNPQKDLRTMLGERSHPGDWNKDLTTKRKSTGEAADEILKAIQKRKQNKQNKQHPGRQRERTRGTM